jgi:hypothetical protein
LTGSLLHLWNLRDCFRPCEKPELYPPIED